MSTDRLQQALGRIDEANAKDPNTESADGANTPAALLYGRRMSEQLQSLRPDAPEALQIAARAQHIRRWEIPRTDFPEGRQGYHRWRTTLYAHHADKTAAILRDLDYDPDTVARVSFILQKKKLKTDPDVQALEDAAALVFLQHHLPDFIARDDMTDEKLIPILQKTWAKMSETAQEAALGLPLPGRATKLLKRALQ